MKKKKKREQQLQQQTERKLKETLAVCVCVFVTRDRRESRYGACGWASRNLFFFFRPNSLWRRIQPQQQQQNPHTLFRTDRLIEQQQKEKHTHKKKGDTHDVTRIESRDEYFNTISRFFQMGWRQKISLSLSPSVGNPTMGFAVTFTSTTTTFSQMVSRVWSWVTPISSHIVSGWSLRNEL